MAREVVVSLWCDLHLAESEGTNRVPGKTFTITLDDMGPLEIDLCEQDELTVLKPLRDVLTEHGARPLDTPPKPTRGGSEEIGPFKCPGCHRELMRLGSLRNHCIADHKRSLADLNGTAAYFCPADKVVGEGPCGLGYETLQGVTVHLARTHQWTQEQRDEWSATRREPHVTNRQLGAARRKAAEGADPLPLEDSTPEPTALERKRERDRVRGAERRAAAAKAAGRTYRPRKAAKK